MSNESERERYALEREKRLERARKRRRENPEKYREESRRYREKDREAYNAYMREYNKRKKVPTPVEKADIGKIFALWRAGWNCKAIAEDTGTDENDVKRFLEENA